VSFWALVSTGALSLKIDPKLPISIKGRGKINFIKSQKGTLDYLTDLKSFEVLEKF
jgi:hypothetical protein